MVWINPRKTEATEKPWWQGCAVLVKQEKIAGKFHKKENFELLTENIKRIANLQLEGGQLLFEEYKIQYVENTSWKVQAYSIYARVVKVPEIERVSVAKEGDFWYKNISCVNTVQSAFHVVLCLSYINTEPVIIFAAFLF